MPLNLEKRTAVGSSHPRHNETSDALAAIELLRDAQRMAVSDRASALRCISHATSLLGGQEQLAEPTRGGLALRDARIVKRYIETNLDDPISVAALSSLTELSNGYFSKAFRVTFGNSPHMYILSCRIARAKDLMIKDDTPLAMIAIDCGFSDQSHMCKVFRRSVGATPREWRRDHCGHAALESGTFGVA